MYIICRMSGGSCSSSFSPPFLGTTETWREGLAKILLILLGLCLWGAAVASLFGGAFVIATYTSYEDFFQNSFFFLPSRLAFTSAVLLFLTGALAMLIPVKNTQRRQGMLMYLLVILLCLEASSAILTHVYSTREASHLTSRMSSLFHQYNRTVPNHPSNEAVDAIQQQLQCCGVYNYTDWCVQALPDHLQMGPVFAPTSCCKEAALGCTNSVSQLEELFEEGCLQKLVERLHFVRQYMIWCSVAAALVETLTFISTGVLVTQQLFQDFHILDSASFS